MLICPSCGEENPARFRLCGYCGTALAAELPALEVRKTVSVVFSDLQGSTSLGESLDSEALREVMTSYFDAMSSVLVEHGATVEKYIGDAIMAVFGLPTLHEDDALRAARAALGMEVALRRLNDALEHRYGIRLTTRTGVNTGEVVAGDPTTGQRLVTGDAVNTAARLEQAAGPNEVLIGPLTHELIRDAVVVEPVAPLELKGKAERVPAYRLLQVRGDEGRRRNLDAPLVGRASELGVLDGALGSAVAGRSAQLVTVVGDAGVGKSRLVREFVAAIGDRADVLRGRCLPYGQGITFWPLLEICRAAAEIDEVDGPEEARAKLGALVGDHDVAARLASIAGLESTDFPLAEIEWAARRLFELLAARRPLVAIVDDIHWAEPAFLGLLDHVRAEAEAPVLLVATARPDLLESHPERASDGAGEVLTLGPLDAAGAHQIVDHLLGRAGLPDELRQRIVEAAEGNPLFVEQLLAMLLESGHLRFDDGRWVRADEAGEILVPPTIQALLAARLDRLGREERLVVEPASVIGLWFAAAAVAELAPAAIRPAVQDHLVALGRRGIVRHETAAIGADADHRFGHLLIRDAAYGGMLKRSRADHHERFVAWADRVNAERGRAAEFEEILGYHLEQAYGYLAELGPLDEHGLALGRDAAGRLAAAGRRAYARGDMHAAANLFGRAVALLAERDPERLAMLPYLAETLWERGDLDAATAILDEADRLAALIGDRILASDASISRLFVENLQGTEHWSERVAAATQVAIPIYEAAAHHAGLARAYWLLTWMHGTLCHFGDAERSAEQALVHAREARAFRREMGEAPSFALAAYLGPTPVLEAIARCEVLLDQASDDRGTAALVGAPLAQLLAMAGEFGRARRVMEDARTALLELGRHVLAASLSNDSWRIELLAGDPKAAELSLRRDIAVLESMGERYFLSTLEAGLTHVLLAQERTADADVACQTAETVTAEDDVVSQILWRSGRARIATRQGDRVTARRYADDAVERARGTDGPILLADALVAAAEVAAADGRADEVAECLTEALELYRVKGDAVSTLAIERALRDGSAVVPVGPGSAA